MRLNCADGRAKARVLTALTFRVFGAGVGALIRGTAAVGADELSLAEPLGGVGVRIEPAADRRHPAVDYLTKLF